LVSQSSIYRLLKANDLIASAAFTIIKAGGEFKVETTAPDQFRRVDFRYPKGLQAFVIVSPALPERWSSAAIRSRHAIHLAR
jgi:hypothetical protein